MTMCHRTTALDYASNCISLYVLLPGPQLTYDQFLEARNPAERCHHNGRGTEGGRSLCWLSCRSEWIPLQVLWAVHWKILRQRTSEQIKIISAMSTKISTVFSRKKVSFHPFVKEPYYFLFLSSLPPLFLFSSVSLPLTLTKTGRPWCPELKWPETTVTYYNTIIILKFILNILMLISPQPFWGVKGFMGVRQVFSH